MISNEYVGKRFRTRWTTYSSGFQQPKAQGLPKPRGGIFVFKLVFCLLQAALSTQECFVGIEQHEIYYYFFLVSKVWVDILLHSPKPMKSWNYNFSFCDTAITCGPPPPVLYGKVEGSDYRWGASVSYSCAEGYQLSNTAILSCEGRGVWRGDIPQCLRKFSGYSCVGLHQSYHQLSWATVTFSLFKKNLS